MDLERIFEQAETLMNDAVDLWLGDVVEVSAAGAGGPWVQCKCFVLGESGAQAHQMGSYALRELDGLDYRVRMKIDASFVPDVSRARFRSGKLGNQMWMAGADQPEGAGRYLIFDIQRSAG